MLAEPVLVGSMGRRGNPYDSAKAEIFTNRLKVEGVYPMAFKSFAEAVAALPRFIEAVYNTRWPHSAIGYLSPAQFEGHNARQMGKTTA